MEEKKVPVKWFGKVVGTGTVKDGNIILVEIDEKLISEEEKKILFPQNMSYFSIDPKQSREP